MTSEKGSAVPTLNLDMFDELLAQRDFLIINFYAKWCGPCTTFQAVFADTAGENNDVTFAMVNVESQRELAAAFQVEAVPKLAVIRAGALVFSHEGTLSADALNDVIRQARALDVDELRRTVAERTSHEG
jgi:thioredoxin 1